MRSRIKAVLLAGAVALAAGCATQQQNDALERRVKLVAQLGTGEALFAHPTWRADFEKAVASLKVVEAGDSVSVAQVVAVIQRLPLAEINSPRGRLYVATGLLLLEEAGVPTELDPDGSRSVKAVARGIRVGIENALAYTAPPSP